MRRGYLPKRNRARAAKAFAKAYGSSEFVEFTRARPCIVCGATPSETAHVTKTRGAGGGPEDCAPLCFSHHREQGDTGVETFQRKYGILFEYAAAENWRRWNSRLDGLG